MFREAELWKIEFVEEKSINLLLNDTISTM